MLLPGGGEVFWHSNLSEVGHSSATVACAALSGHMPLRVSFDYLMLATFDSMWQGRVAGLNALCRLTTYLKFTVE